MKVLFTLKQYVKMLIQNRYLPYIYRKACCNPVQKGRILFADAHHDTLTGNMKAVYQSLVHKDYDIAIYCRDIQKMSAKDMLKFMKQFIVVIQQ